MRLFAFADPDARPALGLATGGARILPLRSDDLRSELRHEDDLAGVRRQSERLAGAVGLDGATVRPLPAIEPGKVVCVGLNYRDHVAEGAGREVPAWPLLFAKFASAVVADGEAVVRPEGTLALVF